MTHISLQMVEQEQQIQQWMSGFYGKKVSREFLFTFSANNQIFKIFSPAHFVENL